MSRYTRIALGFGLLLALTGCGTLQGEHGPYSRTHGTQMQAMSARVSGVDRDARSMDRAERSSGSMRADFGIPTPQPARERFDIGPVPQPPIPGPGPSGPGPR